MTRTMYDAIDVGNLPTGGDLYAGYDDGIWPDAAAIAARFPGKEVIRITVNPADNYGVIGDGPPDNGTWPQWVGWVQMRRTAGEDPWINTNIANWQDGKDAFSAAKVDEPHWWIAHYDGDPTIPAGALMKQYATGDYDTSSAASYLPGIDPAPVPPTTPKPSQPVPLEEDPMQIEPLSAHPGEYALVAPSGLGTLALVADGYSQPAGGVRLAIWVGSECTVLDDVTIGGASGVHTFGHPLPTGCTGVTVRRLDSENYPVAIGFRP